MGGFAARIDGLTASPEGASPEEAARRRALLLAMGGTFLVSAFAWMLLPAIAGIAIAITFTCLSFCGALGVALLASLSGRRHLSVQAALVVLAAQLALLVAAAGGLQSPATALLMALPLEAWLAMRERRAVAWGSVGMVAAAALSILFSGVLPGHASPSAWHWLFPAIYAVSVAARHPLSQADAAASPLERSGEIADADPDVLRLRFAANGDLMAAGPGAEAMLGVGEELLGGTGLFERIHVADRVTFLCALADMREGAANRHVELRLRVVAPGSSGEAPCFRHFVLDLRPCEGADAAVLGILRDHSEVAGLRAALAAAEDAARGLEIAKGNFLASVSHELRTPLNSIIGFSDMLMCEVHGSFANAQQKENVGIIREAGLHLLGVVNSILDVSKIESGSYAINPEPFRFDEAVKLCCQLMRLQADAKSVELRPMIPAALGEVTADRRAVQQILINLVSNAIKFTPAGGTIAIGASKIGTRLHFWVSDTGIGISEDDLGRIGQPFTQVHNDYTRQYDGVGLGLVLVKGLVMLHEGTLSIDSALGSGTTVTVTMPVEGPREKERPHQTRPALDWMKTQANTHGTFRKAG